MKLNKHTTINFIHRGKQYKLICMYSHTHKGIVPVYMCKDIQDVITLTMSDNSILTIVSEDKLNYDKENMNYYIIKNILNMYYNNSMLADVCCAYWIGFSKVIDMINNNKELNKEQKDKHIETLEKIIVNKEDVDLKIPKLEDILNTFKYIEVI